MQWSVGANFIPGGMIIDNSSHSDNLISGLDLSYTLHLKHCIAGGIDEW